MTTVRDATIALMRDLRMTTVFGNPGSTELPLFRDFPQDFRYVLGLQESIVLGMADGFAQATRTAAFVNLHSAAGVGHALGNLFTAYKNQTPLVVTAGQQARSILPYEPFLFAERPTEFPQPYVKWAVEPARAEDVPAAVARAWYVAMQPPCGPTFVSIPIDDWDRDCEPVAARKVSARNPGDPALLEEAAAMLAKAKSPAIVVGAGVARDDAWDEVIALAEKHNAPVRVAPMSARCSFPEDHPLFAGFLTAGREPIVADLDGHDLVLVLGGPMSLYHVEGFGPHLPEGTQLIQIADNPAQVAWNPAGIGVVADTKLAIARLLDGEAPQRPAPPPLVRPAPLDGSVLSDAYLLERIAAVRPDGAILVEESPSGRGAMHDRLPIVMRDGFYTTASGGLGHGLPAAVGVALGRPGERVIALLGDGSAMYAIQGLHAAVQWNLPISFIIVNNGRYEALHSFGRVFGMQQLVGTRLPDLDFVALAAGQGMKGERVSDPVALDAALARCFTSDGPSLIEVVVD